MKVKDLREWLKIVPEEYDDCELMFRTITPIPDSDELMAGDDPIVGASIDISSREACLYNRESQEIINNIK